MKFAAISSFAASFVLAIVPALADSGGQPTKLSDALAPLATDSRMDAVNSHVRLALEERQTKDDAANAGDRKGAQDSLPMVGSPPAGRLPAASPMAAPPPAGQIGGASRGFYLPPVGAPPAGRIGGASRGPNPSDADVRLDVLAPDTHAGRTTKDQPVLYWTASAAITVPVEIVVTDRTSVKPLYRVMLQPPVSAGLHRVDLTGTSLRLRSGPLYRITVSAIVNDSDRSQDSSATGFIEKTDQIIAGSATVVNLAGSGLWYDALDVAIKQEPGNRNALLADVGLPPVTGPAATP